MHKAVKNHCVIDVAIIYGTWTLELQTRDIFVER